MKLCSKCREEKSEIEFYRDRNRKRADCKSCVNKINAQWSKDNPELKKLIDRRYKLKTMYGISMQDYEVMLRSQGNKCAIQGCGATKPGGRGFWHIDHCHTSGKVRGILCHNCNIALGYAADNIQKLKGMIRYLSTRSAVQS